MLKSLERILPEAWTDELYSEAFRVSTSPYKDFDHTLKHVSKALNRLTEMVEEADHGDASFDKAAIKKYLADLVISTARAALVSPEAAVRERMRRKMGVVV